MVSFSPPPPNQPAAARSGRLELKDVHYYASQHQLKSTAKGTLLLEPNTLSFRARGYDLRWRLAAITVDKSKSKGLFGQGIKIHGAAAGQDKGSHQEKYTFTRVSSQALEVLRGAIAAAKAVDTAPGRSISAVPEQAPAEEDEGGGKEA